MFTYIQWNWFFCIYDLHNEGYKMNVRIIIVSSEVELTISVWRGTDGRSSGELNQQEMGCAFDIYISWVSYQRKPSYMGTWKRAREEYAHLGNNPFNYESMMLVPIQKEA